MMLLLIFAIGYSLLVFEHHLKINKSAIALVTGTFMWLYYFEFNATGDAIKYTQLITHLSDISQVLLFLIGAMTIVELIAEHRGFDVIRPLIMISSPRKLFWVLSILGFWMSSLLDNLTTILVLVSLIQQTIKDHKVRMVLAAGLVFVVNVGGAWTPIGDITTTMLWIEGRVNTLPLMLNLGVPSLLSFLVFTTLYSYSLPNEKVFLFPISQREAPAGSLMVLTLGVIGFISVPFLKLTLDMPPFMGMLISLGVLWLATDIFHKDLEGRKNLKVEYILTKIDISCIMFFLGVLLAVACLESSGALHEVAAGAQSFFHNAYYFTFSLGILSALIDNVPLVAGVIKMFDPSTYPPDHVFWFLNAFCAGVGGSLLIIGSAPGVALMSVNDIKFLWYFKKVTWIAFISYIVGWAGIYTWGQCLQYFS